MIKQTRLAERAEVLGDRMRSPPLLASFKGREVVAIRGIGLLAGIEFARADQARRFVMETLERGVITNGH